MSKVAPTDMLFGWTSGFAARSASCEILNFSASSLKVSPDWMTYKNGVEVGTGVSTTVSALGVEVGLGCEVAEGWAVSTAAVCGGAQAARRKIRGSKWRIR
jgi:hypothetical protein